MSALRYIRMLTRYTAWADGRLFDALSKLPEAGITAQRDTGFGNMIHTLNHAYVVDKICKAQSGLRATPMHYLPLAMTKLCASPLWMGELVR